MPIIMREYEAETRLSRVHALPLVTWILQH